MEVQNIQTKVKYKMPRSSWDALGKNQKLFKILDEVEQKEIPPQIIDNIAKPSTGDKIEKNNTTNKSKKVK